jgi:hypothetical protein
LIRGLAAAVLLFGLLAGAPAAGRGPEDETAPARWPSSIIWDPTLPLARGSGPILSVPYAPAPAPFRLTVNGQRVPFDVLGISALPHEPMEIASLEEPQLHGELRFSSGMARSLGPSRWIWTAPGRAGTYAIAVRVSWLLKPVRLNVFVLHPYQRLVGGRLGAYAIGRYNPVPLRGLNAYLPPRGFTPVCPGDEDLLLSPHFNVGQFLCKQGGDPNLVTFSEALIQKLEAILGAVNDSGFHVSTLQMISGFRTPDYNARIGNETEYSRHLWGDAADIFVDANGDGLMDDLNHDGRVDLEDARRLLEIIESLEAGRPELVRGGIGLYAPTYEHGPFVHVDTRGYSARW